MKKSVEKVAIVKCKSYNQKEVDKAIRKLLKLLNFPVNQYKKILIKPNVLGIYDRNQKAITTHPSLIGAVCRELKGEKVIGESSFTDTEKTLKKLMPFKNIIVFEEGRLIKIKDSKAKVLKNFYLPQILKQADLVVNVSKLKTHSLTKMTGAIKNLYGCIPGGMKQVFHKKAQGDKKFSSLLVDIYQNIEPELNIMDAIIAMEGEGPSAGKPKDVGLILASKNAVALDIAAARIMGFEPKNILTIKEAVNRGLYSGFEIEVAGELKKISNLKFEKPTSEKKNLVRVLLRRLARENPIITDKDKCVKCGLCAGKCPVKAITLKPYPEIDRKKCIRCFCCIEICPQHALRLKETLFRRLVGKIRKKRKRKLRND